MPRPFQPRPDGGFGRDFPVHRPSVTLPSDVLGASTLSAKCDGVSLRTKASTNSTRKAVLPSGVQVYAVTKVTGGSWRVTCAGRTHSATPGTASITSTAGAPRRAMAFRTSMPRRRSEVGLPVHEVHRLRRRCRANPAQHVVTRKAVLRRPMSRSTAVARVSGGSWRVTCNGMTKSGSCWFRITTVNGQERRERAMASPYVYAATCSYSPTAPPQLYDPDADAAPPRTRSRDKRPRDVDRGAAHGTGRQLGHRHRGRERDLPGEPGRQPTLGLALDRARFADRTNPVTVRAETRGGVTSTAVARPTSVASASRPVPTTRRGTASPSRTGSRPAERDRRHRLRRLCGLARATPHHHPQLHGSAHRGGDPPRSHRVLLVGRRWSA